MMIMMTSADKSSSSSFRITGYLDFGLHNTTFWKLNLFLSSGEGVGDTYIVGFVIELLRLALSMGLLIKSENSTIPRVIHHFQNPFESIHCRHMKTMINLMFSKPFSHV
jgi:hypothetical protein